MADAIVKNGLVITMDESCRVLPNTDVLIEDSRIVSVGQGLKPDGEPDEVVNAKGKIVMPGLVCSHNHSSRALLNVISPERQNSNDLIQVLRNHWWKGEEVLNKEDAYTSALYCCMQFIRSGVTFFADTFSGPNAISGGLDQISTAVEDARIRAVVSFEATERNTRAEGSRGMRENERFIRKLKKKPSSRVMGMIALHASFTVSDELLRWAGELSREYKVPLTIHAAEGLADVCSSYSDFNRSVIQRLDDFGLLAPTTVLGHCVHVNGKEIGLIKRSGAGVAHVPISDMFHGSGVAPVRQMVNSGITAGIGGDGLSLDGFQDIRATYLLQKVMDKTPDALPSLVILKMATSWGAKLYGLGNELGSIKPGKLGDLVILKPSFPMITPDNVMWHLVNSARREDIETVLVGGRAVMRNGEIQTLSERVVRKAAELSARKIERGLRE